MIYVLTAAAGLWGIGYAMGVTHRARWLMIGLLYVLVLALLVVLPSGHPMQLALGGSFGEWLVLGILAAVVMFYRQGLSWLRRRAAPPMVTETPGSFQGDEIERYARHIMLREIGGPGQKRLKQAKILIIGAGGLGSPAAMYLAAAGVGTIGIVDDDEVEATNLQRQIAHSDQRIGMPKVFSVEKSMRALNPYVDVRPYHRRLTADIATELFADYDLVLDGTDNFDTRYMVNRACLAAKVPLVSAALTQWEGQISVFGGDGPCYECIFPTAPDPALVPTCAEAGVLGPLTGVVGSMMAVEAIKVITDAGDPLRGRMLIYDALYAETRVISLDRRADCQACGGTST